MENENKGFTPQAPSHPCHYGEECSCNKAENESCSNEKDSATKSFSQKLKELENCVDIQCQNGNWNYSEYMRGMANGLILALNIMTETQPIYKEVPVGGYLDQKTAIPENITDVLERPKTKEQILHQDDVCRCLHARKCHGISHSINYTEGKCEYCNCKYFIISNPIE